MPTAGTTPISVEVVDPPAFTPPYDHALCGGLADCGVEVELVTSRFSHGPVPEARGYLVEERFYRTADRFGGSHPLLRRALRAAEHVPEMLSYAGSASSPGGPDIVHWQWLPIPRLDAYLLGSHHPRVFTMHWRLPEAGSRIGRQLTRLLSRFDAVVSHTEHGARRLAADFAVPSDRIHVIPHGALDYLTRQATEQPLPAALAAVEGPVILAFGLVRPYKGTEILIQALEQVPDAELWVVGKPMMEMDDLKKLAGAHSSRVRFVERFIPDQEIPAFMRRADLVCLPYRNIEQSGVLYAALAFGKPLVLSDVGGFPEIAAEGAARLHPAGDSVALGSLLAELLSSPEELRSLSEASLRLSADRYSWSQIGEQTAAMYRRLLDAGGGSPDNR
jgi:glycosyltransferase involved in cell wall biosynthesis